MDSLFTQIEENTDDFINNITDHKQLEKIIKYANEKYNAGEPVLFDDTYDLLVDKLESLDPNNKLLKKIGYPVKKKFKLPFHMGSMTKFKPENLNKINKWKEIYQGAYIVSNKLDGISALITISIDNTIKLFTRGDGTYGTDISHFVKHINIVNTENIIEFLKTNKLNQITLRGELIMKKNIFYEKYATTKANPRNFVAGLINSKNPDKNALQYIDLIFYEIIDPWYQINKQFEILTHLDTYIVPFEYIPSNKLSIEILSNMLKNIKKNYDYEVDGLIVSDTNSHTRNTEGNPEYSFAFKETTDDDIKEAIVNDVIWDISKDGYMIPVVNIVPIKLAGVLISNISAYNAKYIVDNGIGKNAVIKITRSGDVIPKILEVIKKSNNIILPKTSYNWTNSNVDIINTDSTLLKNQLVKLLVYFVKTLEIKNIDEATFKILVNNNIIKSLHDIFYINKTDLLKLDGFAEKKTDKILLELNNGFSKMTLIDLMTASNMFGRNIAKKKIKKIIDSYPNILTDDETPTKKIKLIDELEGFDKITAAQFVNGINDFNTFFNKIPTNITSLMSKQQIKKSSILQGKKYVFTGFRNKNWEKIIQDNGGEIMSSVGKNTNVVVSNNPNESTTKLDKARKYNIKIISIEEMNNFINNL